MDRISQILRAHIDALNRQLEWMAQDVDFAVFGDEQPPIPLTVTDVVQRLDALNAALARHEARKKTDED